MPDCSDSTRRAQQIVGTIASELQQLDEQLDALAQAITLDLTAVLPSELRAGVNSVRSDLLRDAISTLSELAVLTEDVALERRVEIVAAIEQIAAFG